MMVEGAWNRVWAWGTPRKGHHEAQSAINTNRVASRHQQNTQAFLRKRTVWILKSHAFWQSRRETAVKNADFASQLGHAHSQNGEKWHKSLKNESKKAPTHTHIYRSCIFICLHIYVSQFQHNFLMLSLNWRSGALVHYSCEEKKKMSQLPQGSLSLLLHPGPAFLLPNSLWTSRITFASAQRIRCRLLLCIALNTKTPSFSPALSCSGLPNVCVMLRKPSWMSSTDSLLVSSREDAESLFCLHNHERPCEKNATPSNLKIIFLWISSEYSCH